MEESQYTTSSSFIFSGEMKSDWTFTDHKELASRRVNILYSATHKGCRYLLKALKPEYRNKDAYELQMLKEYRLGKSLRHEHVVQTYGMVDDAVAGKCIVMEYIDGCNLREWLTTHPSRSKRHEVFLSILEGIAYCHAKQVTHCDIKPSNIMITNKGENVKLIDFGLSNNDNYLMLKQSGGTRGYMAPEQMVRDATFDNRTDIYALGCLMGDLFPYRYHLLRAHCKKTQPSKRVQTVNSLRKRYLLWHGMPWGVLFALLFLLGLGIIIDMSSKPVPEPPSPTPVVVYDTITVDQQGATNAIISSLEPTIEAKIEMPNTADVLQEISEKFTQLYRKEIAQCIENETYNYDIDSEIRRRCTMIVNNYCQSDNQEQHVYIREKASTIQQQLNEQFSNQLHQCRIAIYYRNR